MRALLVIGLLLATQEAPAQDTLVVKRNNKLHGRVTYIDRTWIHFKTPANWLAKQKHLDSVDRQIKIKVVRYINYGDGRHWQRPAYAFVRRGYKNTVTMDAPTYMYVGTFPGVSVGLGYERFLDKRGRYSLAFSVHRYWAGTAAYGELRNGEVRSNLQGMAFEPGFFYHPFGNNHLTDMGLGLSMPLGTVTRYETIGTKSSYTEFVDDGSHVLIAFLLQANITFQSRGHFVFTIYGSCGPMIPSGVTSGLTGQFGFKIGGRF